MRPTSCPRGGRRTGCRGRSCPSAWGGECPRGRGLLCVKGPLLGTAPGVVSPPSVALTVGPLPPLVAMRRAVGARAVLECVSLGVGVSAATPGRTALSDGTGTLHAPPSSSPWAPSEILYSTPEVASYVAGLSISDRCNAVTVRLPPTPHPKFAPRAHCASTVARAAA